VVRESLAVIEEESDHLAQLIDDLLDASRLQAGALVLNPSAVSLAETAKRLVERFSRPAAEHPFDLEFPPDFPLVQADEERMTQVLSNLISNAIKYSPAGGRIKVHGHATPSEVIVCVSDEGPGIAKEDAPRVFDRFYRANEAARTTKGAGLGLYLAKAVVDAHGGRIWVDERAEKGTRICLALPRE
jgi:signal transduction histidine kinase